MDSWQEHTSVWEEEGDAAWRAEVLRKQKVTGRGRREQQNNEENREGISGSDEEEAKPNQWEAFPAKASHRAWRRSLSLSAGQTLVWN